MLNYGIFFQLSQTGDIINMKILRILHTQKRTVPEYSPLLALLCSAELLEAPVGAEIVAVCVDNEVTVIVDAESGSLV